MKKLLLLPIIALLALPCMAQVELTEDNAKAYYEQFKTYFTDGSCSEMVLPYSAMTDEQLRTMMSAMPEELITIALKVKNNTWAKREKEFRVAEYEPHSNVGKWQTLLALDYQYADLQLPTGITAQKGEKLIIFIDEKTVPGGTFITLDEIAENKPYVDRDNWGATKYLSKGINIVTVAEEDAILFIGCPVTTDTTATSKRLADYPKPKIHIEGGKVNGYFDKQRHTDEDWRDMLANHFEHYSVQVKGERVLFHMVKDNIAAVCPNTITDAIGWWDQCVHWQHELMGIDKYHDRFNSFIMARDGYENMYMYATSNYTYYEHGTLVDILPWATVYADPGKMWGPAHEIGHVNQGTINIVSCTESSNNLFSNVQIHRTGKTTTRGLGVAYCMEEYLKKTPFPLRGDAIGKARMFFQLYLYFHAAGKDKTFYPRLHDALRKDPMEKGERDRNWTAHTMAKDNQLKFAEKCCEVAQMDLSEFFEAWGFFEPMKDAFLGDYGNYNINLTEEEAAASRARMQRFAKKGGHLMFIEDRIKPSPREDGVNGNRLNFNEEFVIGKMGNVGQWGDYIDESVKAEGYYYAVSGSKIQISTTQNAKGALGFKLYDAATGELLSFSNTYQISIPETALTKQLRVVAAQADGTDYNIPHIEESDDESLAKEALNALITSTKKYSLYTTTTGKEVGYYYANVVKEFKTLYNKAKKAVKNNDTSEHSFKEWAKVLREAQNVIDENPNAFVKLDEANAHTLENVDGYNFLCNDAMGVKGVTYIDDVTDKNNAYWVAEYTGEGDYYYIKDNNGYYISDIDKNGAYCNGRRIENAVEFRVIYNSDCTLSFQARESNLYLAINSEDMAVGTEALNKNAMWLVTIAAENMTAIEVIEEEKGDSVLYDLQGRKIANPQKGIYIKNGKKVIY